MVREISAREEKAANKEAEAVLASLSRAGEAAVAQTLDDICECLKRRSVDVPYQRVASPSRVDGGVEGQHQWHRGSGSHRRQAW